MPRYRTCIDCGAICTSTRCARCQRHHDQQRNAARPGHRTAHAQARRQWAPLVNTGTVHCSRCPDLIAPGQAWDIDQRPSGWHPSHATCNRAAGGRHTP